MTSSAGTSGFTKDGSQPASAIASRMTARSTTHGTPVKSCMRMRAGLKAISFEGSAFGSHSTSARTSSAVTATPSSLRRRFSSRTLSENGRRAARSPMAARRNTSYERSPTESVPRAPKLSVVTPTACPRQTPPMPDGFDVRVDPLSGAVVIVDADRQQRPNLPTGCPFCPGGLEAPEPCETRWFVNRWPSIPDGRVEVLLYTPDHDASLWQLGVDGVGRVLDLWVDRTTALGARPDVDYVLVFEKDRKSTRLNSSHANISYAVF